MPNPLSPMRFPGSIAEVQASPEGPQVGAFFDLDGTLVAGYTGIALTQERIRRRDVGVGELIGMVLGGINLQLGISEFEDLHPGTVDVAVFPPIAVDDWTSANLSRRIDGVRQLYLDTLADWPVDELPKPKKRMARTKS
jgi:hypothetical protein